MVKIKTCCSMLIVMSIFNFQYTTSLFLIKMRFPFDLTCTLPACWTYIALFWYRIYFGIIYIYIFWFIYCWYVYLRYYINKYILIFYKCCYLVNQAFKIERSALHKQLLILMNHKWYLYDLKTKTRCKIDWLGMNIEVFCFNFIPPQKYNLSL